MVAFPKYYSKERGGGRLLIALERLRGVSALWVAYYHLFIFFFYFQATVADLCLFPPLSLGQVEGRASPWFDLGRFAVTQFFLMSGFFLPHLLERYPNRCLFFKNRFFRLFPVFLLVLGLSLLALRQGWYWQGRGDFHFKWSPVLLSLFGAGDWFGCPPLLGVNWTFEIEVKSILWIMLFFNSFQRKRLAWPLLSLCLGIAWAVLGGEILMAKGGGSKCWLGLDLVAIVKTLTFFSLINLGALLSWYLRGEIEQKKFLAYGLVCIVLFILGSLKSYHFFGSFWGGPWRFPSIALAYTVSGVLGVAFFGWVCFKGDAWFFQWPVWVLTLGLVYLGIRGEGKLLACHLLFLVPASLVGGLFNNFLKGIASISYPLYLIHAMPLWLGAYCFHGLGWLGQGPQGSCEFFIFFTVGLWLCFGLAYGIRRWIEEPFRSLGKPSRA